MDKLFPPELMNPTCITGILIMPVLIIGILKMWKRLKDKKADKPLTNAIEKMMHKDGESEKAQES